MPVALQAAVQNNSEQLYGSTEHLCAGVQSFQLGDGGQACGRIAQTEKTKFVNQKLSFSELSAANRNENQYLKYLKMKRLEKKTFQ